MRKCKWYPLQVAPSCAGDHRDWMRAVARSASLAIWKTETTLIWESTTSSRRRPLAEPDAKSENEENNQGQKATSCCGNPLRRHELPSSPLGKRAAPPVIWQQPSAPRDIRVA